MASRHNIPTGWRSIILPPERWVKQSIGVASPSNCAGKSVWAERLLYAPSDHDLSELPVCRGHFSGIRPHDTVEQGRVEVSDGPGDLRVPPRCQLFGAARYQCNHAAGLVRSGLGMLMNVHKDRVVEQALVAFGDRFQFRYQVSKLL